MKKDVTIEVPDGKYCCNCNYIAHTGDFYFCVISRLPLKCDESFYLKNKDCLEGLSKN